MVVKPLRILHVVGAMNIGGTETMLMNIYRKVDRDQVQFDFISYSQDHAHYDDEIISLGGSVIRLSNPQSIIELYRAININGPYDAVHSHTLFHCGLAALAAKLAGVKIRISHAHTTWDRNDGFLRKVYMVLMRKFISLFSTNLLYCSKEAGNYLFGNKHTIKSEYYPNLIDYSGFLEKEDTVAEAFKQDQGLNNSIVIGHIGRFMEAKNHRFLIDIMEQIVKRNIDAKLLLVGDGVLRKQIEEVARAKGISESIQFIGIRDDIATLLHSMDIFVFPSIYEGLGLVLLEAQACGLPCIVSEAIQPEADLNIGLISRCSLEEDANVWADRILEQAGRKESNSNHIIKGFEQNGYSFPAGLSKLNDIYKNDHRKGSMKNILISSFDMEVGGVERSLVSMLNKFDYNNYNVDLMLYSHTGDFMNLLPKQSHLLAESSVYRTFRMSIGQMITRGNFILALVRILAKYRAGLYQSIENGYRQMQYMWKYSLPFLPKFQKEYDIAISYLWPHYFISHKVKARTKIAWIHTDFSTVDTDINLDIKMWNKFNYIAAVSEDCKKSFITKYPMLEEKVVVIENITSPEFVRMLSNEKVTDNPMSSDHRFKLISVARLSHAKGIDNAVKALKILKDKGYKDIAWYVVGYGGDESMLRDLIEEYKLEDSFILLGKKINPYPYMKEAELYVQPSRYEGKAVTVGEAQILSKPVMITNYATAKSQVVDGFDGYIAELSIEGIADGIVRLYKDHELRNKLANNCRRTDYVNNSELDKLYQLIEIGG